MKHAIALISCLLTLSLPKASGQSEHDVVVYGDSSGAVVAAISAKRVTMEGKRIKAITTLSGKTYRGKMFIDATYVGDLMAAAGVTFTVGREPEAQYGEDMNGVRRGDTNPRVHYGQRDKDHFVAEVDPYVKPADPSSGLLKERYEAAGGSISVKLIPGRGHEISPAFFECPELIEFILKHSQM